MIAWARVLFKWLPLLTAAFVGTASPFWGSVLLLTPATFGVLCCGIRVVRLARRDGWLAEI
ncbi:MAG: hypothetical protein Q4B13_10265 [Lautropia sp.]|nr:hypothetical protein [Lautropia sp.]